MGNLPLVSQEERSHSALDCISHHVGKRSAGQGQQDEVRPARASNTALGVFTKHESRNTWLKRYMGVLKPFSLFFRPGRHSMRNARLTIVLQSARGSLKKMSPTKATRP